MNTHNEVAAFFTSFAIGAANLVLFKLAPDASGIEIAAYLFGGPLAIVTSMKFHNWLFGKKSHGKSD